MSMVDDIRKKKKGSGKDVLPGDEKMSHMDPVYKNAKMSVLSDIANMAGKSMGHDLKNHKARTTSLPMETKPGEASKNDALRQMLASSSPEGHNEDSMEMLDADQEDDHLHGTVSPGEQDHTAQRYAKGGRVGDVLGKHESPGIVKYQDNELDDDEGEHNAKGFDFGKDARNHKEDELKGHDGYVSELHKHEEEEMPAQHEAKQASKYGSSEHEYEPSHHDSDDELVGMSDEDIKLMMDHLDSKLKARWKQNK